MGLFSDIISGIGDGVSDLFGGGGGDNNNNKRKQPQAPTIAAPQNNQSSVKLPAVLQMAKGPTQTNPIHPVNFGSQQPNPLQAPAAPTAPATPATPIATTSYSSAPHTSLFGHLLHGAEDVGEGVAGVGTAAAAGTLRAGEGLVTGAEDLPNMAIHLATKPVRAIAGSNSGVTKALNSVDAQSQRATNDVQDPVNWLAQKTDMIPGMFNHENGDSTITGRIAHDLYTPAQVAANIATIAPAVATIAGKVGEAGNITSKIADFTKAQSAIPTLDKVPVLGSALDKLGVGGKASEATDETASADKTPAESGTKAPGEPTNAPAGEAAPPVKDPAAAETGVKPPAEPAEPVETPTATAPITAPVDLRTQKDLQSSLDVAHNLLGDTNPYDNEKSAQDVLTRAVAHQGRNQELGKIVNSRLGGEHSEAEQGNILDALEGKRTRASLSAHEKEGFDGLKNKVLKPSDIVRAKSSTDYQSQKNYFPQTSEGSLKDAAQGAKRGKGVNGKIKTFADLLDRQSRYSEQSMAGKFTDANGKSVTGDARTLGLIRKGDGTFRNTAGKVYNYSRASTNELKNAGVKLRSPGSSLGSYLQDTLNLKTKMDAADSLIKNADRLGLHTDDLPGTTAVSIKGSDGVEHTFYTDEQTAKAINDSPVLGTGRKAPSLVKAFNKATSGIVQGTVINPLSHGLNLVANAAIGSGERANGLTGLNALVRSVKPLTDEEKFHMQDDGVYFPSYGKNAVNTLSKLTHGVTKWNEKSVAAIDAQVRAGMYRQLTSGDKAISGKEAADVINRWMGGHEVYHGDSPQLGMFWHYFTRQAKNGVRLFSMAATGKPGPLINAGIAAGVTYGADKGIQAVTGNQQGYIHPAGTLGLLNDALDSGEDVAKGQYRNAVNPLVSHINPLVSTAYEQLFGNNEYGDKFSSLSGPGNSRVNNLLGITPETNLFANNGRSAAEKVLNTAGIYIPHLAGDQAVGTKAPGASVLNVKNAQNGSSVAFPKDFTGEQENNVVNTLGNNYTTKSAALLGTKTQPQQVKYVDAVNTLKKYGITDTADAQAFSKLNSKDQGSYVSAVDALNKAGTTFSADSLQTQLVKQGDTALAASLNPDISPKLDQSDKNVLEQYYTMTSSSGNVTPESEKWLQNPTNAVNYFGALINQAKATGTLTAEDQNVGATYDGSLDLGDSSNSLYTKYLVSQVNKQNNVPSSTQALYLDTSYDDFKDLAAGPQLTALTTYAEQLAAAGVPNKYYIGADGTSTSGSSSSSSSGSSPYDADVAAGIPDGTVSESFVKPTTDSGLKSVSAVAFKGPKLVKYGPDEKANPYTRTISVKSGVH